MFGRIESLYPARRAASTAGREEMCIEKLEKSGIMKKKAALPSVPAVGAVGERFAT